jgi:gliding motility-associated-like protein
MKRYNYILHAFFWCFVLSIGFTQAQIDTEFWFAAPDVTTSHADRPIFLRMATFANAAQVTITQPANASFTPIVKNIAANSGDFVELTSVIGIVETQPGAQIVNTGLRIVATNPISVYYEVIAMNIPSNPFPLNPEIYGLKGKNGLGLNFIVPSQDDFSNSFWPSPETVDIVATEDGTTIQINSPTEMQWSPSNIQPNNTQTVTLNRGQTFSIRPTNGNSGTSLRGTQITANKPIAVTISDDSIDRNGSQDLIGDQLFPVEKTGLEYIVVRGLDGANQDRLYILATADNTTITVNGTNVATLNARQTHKISNITSVVTYINTSKPVYVMHLTGHQGAGSGIESAMSIIPPIGDCRGTNDASFFKSTDDDFSLVIVTEDANRDKFLLNGNNSLIVQSDFTSVPNKAGWSYTRKSFTNTQLAENDNHRLTTSNQGLFQLGVLLAYRNGAGNIVGSSYAFFSNYDSGITVNLGADRTICNATNTTLDAGSGFTSYSWQRVGEATVLGTNATLSVSQSGTYKVTVTRSGCTATDEVVVTVLPALSFTGLADNYCVNASAVSLQASPAGGTFQINNTNATSFNPTTLGVGNHTVTYTYQGVMCLSKIVTVNPLPTATITGLNAQYCVNDAPITLQGTPTGGVFRVNNVVSTTFNPASLGAGMHGVIYTVTANACDWTATQSVTVLPLSNNQCFSASFFIPELFSPNGDGKNDKFLVAGDGITSFSLKLFDRFGNLVYEAKTWDEALKGWDGKNKGKDQPIGAYTWQIEGKLADNSDLTYNGKKKGIVNLAR